MFKIDKIDLGDLFIDEDDEVYERSERFGFEYWKRTGVYNALGEARSRRVVLWKSNWWTDHAVMTIRDYIAVYIPPHKMEKWNLIQVNGKYKKK